MKATNHPYHYPTAAQTVKASTLVACLLCAGLLVLSLILFGGAK